MRINYYFLVAGILSILFAVTHEVNGQNTMLPRLNASDLDIATNTTFSYIWHIVSAENVAFGIVLLIMAFYKEQEKVRFVAWTISGIVVLRLFVILGTTLIKGIDIKGMLVDVAAIVIYAAIILLGTRVKAIKKTAV